MRQKCVPTSWGRGKGVSNIGSPAVVRQCAVPLYPNRPASQTPTTSSSSLPLKRASSTSPVLEFRCVYCMSICGNQSTVDWLSPNELDAEIQIWERERYRTILFYLALYSKMIMYFYIYAHEAQAIQRTIPPIRLSLLIPCHSMSLDSSGHANCRMVSTGQLHTARSLGPVVPRVD